MRIAELRSEAVRQFTIVMESTEDETVLKMILEFLKGIDSDDNNALNLSRHYNSIKEKYDSVLSKLAE